MSTVMLNKFSNAEESVRNAWGAAGATMGTGAGVASALLFMLFVYWAETSGIMDVGAVLASVRGILIRVI